MPTICKTCTNKECLKTGRPCKDIESYMRRDGIKSANYIRPKMPSDKRNGGEFREVPFSTIDKLHTNEYLELNPLPEWHGYYRGLKRAIRSIFK